MLCRFAGIGQRRHGASPLNSRPNNRDALARLLRDTIESQSLSPTGGRCVRRIIWCLGAHDPNAPSAAHANERRERVPKLLGLHIIGKAAKTFVSPAGVRRILARVPQTAQCFEIRIARDNSKNSAFTLYSR